MNEHEPNDERVQRLVQNFNPQKVMETLPTSEYTAYSENKGEKLAFCLNTEKGGATMIDEHTLTFVAIHELSHIATKSIGHKASSGKTLNTYWNMQRRRVFMTPRIIKARPKNTVV